jgi:hypothetical protein
VIGELADVRDAEERWSQSGATWLLYIVACFV